MTSKSWEKAEEAIREKISANFMRRLKNRAPTMSILFRRFLEPDRQLIFPKRGDGVTAVPARFFAQGNDERAPMRDAFDLALENSELPRIDQIVRGIDREQRGVNFFQVRAGIVIVRGFDRVKNIIRVICFQMIGDKFVENF